MDKNDYARSLGLALYDAIPKEVFAAIAVSLLTCGGDRLNEAATGLLREWQALYETRIVLQRPPAWVKEQYGKEVRR